MQKFSQKYLIAQFLKEIEEGDEYPASDWPLHVTIAPIFAVNWKNDNLTGKLPELLTKQKPFTALAEHDDYFGSERQIQVTLLDLNKELSSLHYNVVALLKNADATFHDPQYVEEGFRPHATVQSHARLHEGDMVTFNALTIIDMFPNDDPYQRKVIKNMRLLG